MTLENVPDMSGRKRIRMTVNSAYELASNTNIEKLFNQDSHFSFQIGECATSEVIYAKGHESDPANGSWAIINENKYLKIVLHETNNTNSLVYKSNNQILNDYYRNLISINYNVTTKSVTLYVNGIIEPISIDTSQGHYRTSAGAFTGLHVSSSYSLKIGRGVILPYGTFSIYYDLLDQKQLTQLEISDYWNTIKDLRTAPTMGKIIFSTDRDGNYNMYEMNEDGTNQLYKVGVGNTEYYPNYANNSNGFMYGLNAGIFYAKYVKDDNTVFTIPDLHGNTGGESQINSTGTDIYYTRDSGLLYKYTLSGGAINNLDLTTAGINWASWFQYFNDLNPTNDNLILFNRAKVSNNHYLYTRNISTHVETLIFTLPYVSGTSDPRFINAKFSPDGTKIAFDMYFTDSGSDFRIYTCNSDGTNLQMIQQSNITTPIYFSNWSPDGTKLLLSKKFTGIGYTNKFQLFTRDLTTNAEVQLTSHNSDNMRADWKA